MPRAPIHRREFLSGAAAVGGLGLYGRLATAAGLNGGHPLRRGPATSRRGRST